MAYADRNASGSRMVAIVMVALIVAGLGYVFVTGLAYQYIKKKAEQLDVFDVKDPPPPPEEVPPPPPPPDQAVPPPPTQVYAPPTNIPVPSPNTISNTPDPPPPPKQVKKLTPRGSPGSWVTNEDYPAAALRAEQQGTTSFRLDVDATGKVTNCSVTGSSGSSLLDNTACSLLRRRARFNPGEDATGAKTGGTYAGRFRWEMPKD